MGSDYPSRSLYYKFDVIRCVANCCLLLQGNDRYINITNNNDSMELACVCGKKWDYNGANKSYATCPDCRKLVAINKKEEK